MSMFKRILFSWHITRLLFLSCLVSIGNSVYASSNHINTEPSEMGKEVITTETIEMGKEGINTETIKREMPINDENFKGTSVFYKLYIPSYKSKSRDITTKNNVYNFVLKLLSFLKYTSFTRYPHFNCDLPFFGDWKDRITRIFIFPYYNFFPMYRCSLLSKLPFNSSNNLYLGVTDPLFVGGILGRIIGIFFGRIEIVYDMSTFMPDFLKNRVTFTCISFRPLLFFLTDSIYYSGYYLRQDGKVDTNTFVCTCSCKKDIFF